MYSGDPKRPKNIKYYPNTQPVEQTDLMQILSMLFGILSFIIKVKWGIWLSFIFFLSSWVNMKYNTEMKNMIMSFCMLMMGFSMIYFVPPPAPRNSVPVQPK